MPSLDIYKDDHSTVSGGGVYSLGDKATLRCVPDAGYIFVAWVDSSGNEISTLNPYPYTISNSDVDIYCLVAISILPDAVFSVDASNNSRVSDMFTKNGWSSTVVSGKQLTVQLDTDPTKVISNVQFDLNTSATAHLLTANRLNSLPNPNMRWYSSAHSSDGTSIIALANGSEGNVWFSSNSGVTWVDTTPPGLKYSATTSIIANQSFTKFMITNSGITMWYGSITSPSTVPTWTQSTTYSPSVSYSNRVVAPSTSLGGSLSQAFIFPQSVFETTDGGVTWVDIAEYGVNENLNGLNTYNNIIIDVVSNAAGNRIFCTVNTFDIYVGDKVDGMWSWQNLTNLISQSNPSTDIRRVVCDTSGNNVYVAMVYTNEIGGIYKYMFNGTSWSAGSKVPDLSEYNSYIDLRANSDLSKIIALSQDSTLWLYDSSSGWTTIGNALSMLVAGYGVFSNMTDDGVILNGSTGELFISYDYGNTWENATSGQINPEAWYSINVKKDGSNIHVIASGMFGNVCIGNFDGTDWTWRKSDIATLTTGIPWGGCVSDASGKNLAALVQGYNIWTSSDSGATWKSTGPLASYNDIACGSNQDESPPALFLAVINGPILKGTNTNGTWSWEGISDPRYWVSVACSTDGSKVLAADFYGDVWKGVYSSGSWTWSNMTNGLAVSWSSLSCNSDCSIVYAASSGNGVYKSTNNSGFTRLSPNSAGNVWCRVTTDSTGQYVGAVDQENVWVSSDGGSTWNISSPVPSSVYVYITSSPSGQRMITHIYNGETYESIDYGQTWIPIIPELPQGIYPNDPCPSVFAAYDSSGNNLFFSEYNQLLYSRKFLNKGSLTTGKQNISIGATTDLIQLQFSGSNVPVSVSNFVVNRPIVLTANQTQAVTTASSDVTVVAAVSSIQSVDTTDLPALTTAATDLLSSIVAAATPVLSAPATVPIPVSESATANLVTYYTSVNPNSDFSSNSFAVLVTTQTDENENSKYDVTNVPPNTNLILDVSAGETISIALSSTKSILVTRSGSQISIDGGSNVNLPFVYNLPNGDKLIFNGVGSLLMTIEETVAGRTLDDLTFPVVDGNLDIAGVVGSLNSINMSSPGLRITFNLTSFLDSAVNQTLITAIGLTATNLDGSYSFNDLYDLTTIKSNTPTIILSNSPQISAYNGDFTITEPASYPFNVVDAYNNTVFTVLALYSGYYIISVIPNDTLRNALLDASSTYTTDENASVFIESALNEVLAYDHIKLVKQTDMNGNVNNLTLSKLTNDLNLDASKSVYILPKSTYSENSLFTDGNMILSDSITFTDSSGTSYDISVNDNTITIADEETFNSYPASWTLASGNTITFRGRLSNSMAITYTELITTTTTTEPLYKEIVDSGVESGEFIPSETTTSTTLPPTTTTTTLPPTTTTTTESPASTTPPPTTTTTLPPTTTTTTLPPTTSTTSSTTYPPTTNHNTTMASAPTDFYVDKLYSLTASEDRTFTVFGETEGEPFDTDEDVTLNVPVADMNALLQFEKQWLTAVPADSVDDSRPLIDQANQTWPH